MSRSGREASPYCPRRRSAAKHAWRVPEGEQERARPAKPTTCSPQHMRHSIARGLGAAIAGGEARGASSAGSKSHLCVLPSASPRGVNSPPSPPSSAASTDGRADAVASAATSREAVEEDDLARGGEGGARDAAGAASVIVCVRVARDGTRSRAGVLCGDRAGAQGERLAVACAEGAGEARPKEGKEWKLRAFAQSFREFPINRGPRRPHATCTHTLSTTVRACV